MAKEWIDNLADDIKQKNREAAEKYGRDQHYAGVIASVGTEYFVRLRTELQQDVDDLRRRLQGDATAADTVVDASKLGEVRITRARFPRVDAVLTHREDTIVLEYTKEAGAGGSVLADSANRQTRSFAFRVTAEDELYVEDAFADTPRTYQSPEELARQILEVLFAS